MSALSDKLVRQMRAIYPTYPIVQNAADEIDRLTEENARLREALTPSAETKAAYNGEFRFARQQWEENGEELPTLVLDVPWGTVKQIMAAILARAALPKEPA